MQKSVVERRLALSRATERSYDVFAGYAEPSGLEFCEHCNDPECAGELEATELRDLDAGQLRCLTYLLALGGGDDHAGSGSDAEVDADAGNAPGVTGDLRYLLPRLLELLPAGEPLEPEVVLAKIASEGWREWPEPEREAVEVFGRAYWGHILAEYPGEVRAEDGLCGLALLTGDITPYLATWTDDVQAAAIRHCARIINQDLADCLTALRPLRLSGPYWADCPAEHDRLVAWLLDEGRLATFEAAAHADDDPDTVAELSRAFEVLALALKTAPPPEAVE